MALFNKVANFETSNPLVVIFLDRAKLIEIWKKSHIKYFKQRASIIMTFFKLGDQHKIKDI